MVGRAMKKLGGYTERQINDYVTIWITGIQAENLLAKDSIYTLGKIKGVKSFIKGLVEYYKVNNKKIK